MQAAKAANKAVKATGFNNVKDLEKSQAMMAVSDGVWPRVG